MESVGIEYQASSQEFKRRRAWIIVESFISWRAPNLGPKKSLLLSKDVGSRDWYAGSNIYEDDKRKSGLCGGDYPLCSLVKI